MNTIKVGQSQPVTTTAPLRWHWTGKGHEEANDRRADGKPGNRRYTISKTYAGDFQLLVGIAIYNATGSYRTEAQNLGHFATKVEARAAAEIHRTTT